MPFFEYRQNNSGGVFDYKDEGISIHVIIEADTYRSANAKAEDLGLYFDGYGDCNCCGNRWGEAGTCDGDDEPSVYGESLFGDGVTLYSSWAPEGKPEGFIHYKDGTMKAFYTLKSDRLSKPITPPSDWFPKFERLISR